MGEDCYGSMDHMLQEGNFPSAGLIRVSPGKSHVFLPGDNDLLSLLATR